jgi:hypothetical protein
MATHDKEYRLYKISSGKLHTKNVWMSQKWLLYIGPWVVYLFPIDWDPLAQKPTGTKLKFSQIQLFLK